MAKKLHPSHMTGLRHGYGKDDEIEHNGHEFKGHQGTGHPMLTPSESFPARLKAMKKFKPGSDVHLPGRDPRDHGACGGHGAVSHYETREMDTDKDRGDEQGSFGGPDKDEDDKKGPKIKSGITHGGFQLGANHSQRPVV